MKKILIIGATGRTGKHLVQQTIAYKMEPVCLVREESKTKLSGLGPTIIVGSPLNYDDVLKAIEGCDAVLCALNIARKRDLPWSEVISPPDLLEGSINNIVKAMKEKGVRRIITVSAWGVGDSYKEVNWMFRFLINKTNVGIAYKGHEEQEKILRESGLDWTAVRPVGLSNSEVQKTLRVSFSGEKKLNMTISRKDVAKFMLGILQDEKYFQTTPSVSNN